MLLLCDLLLFSRPPSAIYVAWLAQSHFHLGLFFSYSAVHSRSMTPITWQAAVNDGQRLQDILEAAVDGWRQLTSKNSSYCCKTSSKQPLMGIMSRENSRGGFPLPFSRFLLSSVLLLDSGLQFYHEHIHAGLLSETAMLPPSCDDGPGTLLCFRSSNYSLLGSVPQMM